VRFRPRGTIQPACGQKAPRGQKRAAQTAPPTRTTRRRNVADEQALAVGRLHAAVGVPPAAGSLRRGAISPARDNSARVRAKSAARAKCAAQTAPPTRTTRRRNVADEQALAPVREAAPRADASADEQESSSAAATPRYSSR